MRKNRALFSLLAAAVFMSGLSGCAKTSNQEEQEKTADEPLTLTCAITMSEDSVYFNDLKYFERLISEKSNGTLKLDIQSGGVLGGETDYIEGMQAGTIDATIISFSPLSATSEKCGVFEVPFLIRDYEHLKKVWQSEIGEEIREDLQQVGIRSLAVLDFGFRETTNNVRPIKTPEDLKGIKLRVMQSDLQIQAWEALGATPITMAVTEVFSALQTGTIDGQENPINAISSNGFHEVQKYLSITDHLFAPVLLAVSENTWNKMNDIQKSAIQDSIAELEDQSSIICQEYTDKGLEKIKEAGVEINEVDIEKFREAMLPLIVSIVLCKLKSDFLFSVSCLCSNYCRAICTFG